VSRYQKGKTNLDFTGARDSEWQWYQLGHMQVCISLQTDNHASTSLLKFLTGRMPFLPPNQQCQSTEGTFFAYTFATNAKASLGIHYLFSVDWGVNRNLVLSARNSCFGLESEYMNFFISDNTTQWVL